MADEKDGLRKSSPSNGSGDDEVQEEAVVTKKQAPHLGEPDKDLVDAASLTRAVKINLMPRSNEARRSRKEFEFPTNKIRTARYNWLTFFPITLLIQYTKLGNVFWTM